MEVPIGKAQDIIEEAIVFVPQLIVAAAHFLHGRPDVDKMLEELCCQLLIRAIALSQFQGDAHQIKTEETHPASGVGLLKNGATRQLLPAIHHGNVVEPEESAFENVVALAVFPVDPPCEVDQQLVQTAFQK